MADQATSTVLRVAPELGNPSEYVSDALDGWELAAARSLGGANVAERRDVLRRTAEQSAGELEVIELALKAKGVAGVALLTPVKQALYDLALGSQFECLLGDAVRALGAMDRRSREVSALHESLAQQRRELEASTAARVVEETCTVLPAIEEALARYAEAQDSPADNYGAVMAVIGSLECIRGRLRLAQAIALRTHAIGSAAVPSEHEPQAAE